MDKDEIFFFEFHAGRALHEFSTLAQLENDLNKFTARSID